MLKIGSGLVAVAFLLTGSGAARAQGGSFDGTYRPPAGGTYGNSACGTTRFGYAIRVAGGQASMQTVTVGLMQGPVGPDGSLNIVAGNAVLQGKFSGNHFAGSYTVRSCSFNLQYDKG